MERKYGNHEEAIAVAKEAIWLAWTACGGTSGAGFLQDNPDAKKDQVWDRAYNMGDYSGRRVGMKPTAVNADYVFGRMMKLYFKVEGDSITHDDQEPRRDYQAWCGRYPSYAALFDAAETEVLKKAA
jgi:hypothetical protein